MWGSHQKSLLQAVYRRGCPDLESGFVKKWRDQLLLFQAVIIWLT